VALAAAVAVTAFALDRFVGEDANPTEASGPTAPPSGAPDAQPASGRLVYLAGGSSRSSPSWVIELGEGRSRPGPRLPASTFELVDASGAGGGWIGVGSREDDGSITALVLDGSSTDARPRRLAHGDVLAWGPAGTTVVVGRNRSAGQGCPSILVDVVSVRTGSIQSGLAPGAMCGPLLSLGRSAAANYLTGRADDGFGLYVTGTVGVPHLLFGRVALLGSSPVSAFLLERRSAADQGPEPTPGTLLRWRGTGGPVRFEQAPGLPLFTWRVLAWSRDGLQAAVFGFLGSVIGVYLLDVAPGQGPRAPVLVTRTPQADATFADDGTLYVSSRGRLLRFADGALGEVPLPEGAPAPAGPILWLP